MPTDAEKLARNRMATNPFVQLTDAANNDYRVAHSLEYIAFYIGETEKHLERIAVQLENNNSNGAAIRLALQWISQSLASKT